MVESSKLNYTQRIKHDAIRKGAWLGLFLCVGFRAPRLRASRCPCADIIRQFARYKTGYKKHKNKLIIKTHLLITGAYRGIKKQKQNPVFSTTGLKGRISNG